MAEQCLAAIGVPATAADVALHYGSRATGGLLDGWLVAPQDADAVPVPRVGRDPRQAVPLLMTDEDTAAALAEEALQLGDTCR